MADSLQDKLDTVRRACGESEVIVDGVEWEVGEVIDDVEVYIHGQEHAIKILGDRVVILERDLHTTRLANERYEKENSYLASRLDHINTILDQSLKTTREALDLIHHMQRTTDVNPDKLRLK